MQLGFGKITSPIRRDSEDRQLFKMNAYGIHCDLGPYRVEVTQGEQAIFTFSDTYQNAGQKRSKPPLPISAASIKGMVSTAILQVIAPKSGKTVSVAAFTDVFNSDATMKALSEKGKKEICQDALKLYRVYLSQLLRMAEDGLKSGLFFDRN